MIVSTSHRVCTMKNIDFTDFFNVFLSGATIWSAAFLMSLRRRYGYADSLTRPVTLSVGNRGHHIGGGSMNGTPPVEGQVRSTGYRRKSGVAGGCDPPLRFEQGSRFQLLRPLPSLHPLFHALDSGLQMSSPPMALNLALQPQQENRQQHNQCNHNQCAHCRGQVLYLHRSALQQL